VHLLLVRNIDAPSNSLLGDIDRLPIVFIRTNTNYTKKYLKNYKCSTGTGIIMMYKDYSTNFMYTNTNHGGTKTAYGILDEY
jgi:hypothetical protein